MGENAQEGLNVVIQQQRHWRNPYKTKKKRSSSFTGKKKNVSSRKKSNVTYLSAPSKNQVEQMRYTILRMRDNIKQASTMIQQIDQAMDSIVSAFDLMDQFGIGFGKKKGKNQSIQVSSLLKKLNHVDFRQLIEILQSPMIQSLLTDDLKINDVESTTKRKSGLRSESRFSESRLHALKQAKEG